MSKTFICVVSLLLLLVPLADAQENAPRYVLTIPPEHELVEIGDLKAICQPEDRAWVEEALRTAAPTTRPATMPVDLLARLQGARSATLQRLADDFALADTAPIAKRLDTLTDELKRLDEFRPPLFFLCTSPAKLKSLLKEERWTNPGLYYNRLADDVMYRETLRLTADRPMDDTVITVLTGEGDDQARKIARLQRSIARARDEVQKMVSGRGMFICQSVLLEAVLLEVFEPMQLPQDQRWFAVGLAGATSADYAATIIGSPRRELLLLIAAEIRSNPIKPGTIDLLDPPAPDALRREYVPLFADSYRRKSIGVALKIIEPAREKLPVLMNSLREKPAGSAAALIERIQEVTGVDVSADVRRSR